MTKTPEVILLRETWQASIVRDAGTLVMFTIMLGLGVYLQSSVMQWIGGLLFLFFVYARGLNVSQRNQLTIEQARKRLDEIEAAG